MSKFDVKVKSAPRKPKPSWLGRIVPGLLHRVPVEGWVIAGLAAAVLVFGTPYLLISYRCDGRCGRAPEYGCAYWGVQGGRYGGPQDGRCPRIRLFPLDL